MIVLQDEVNEKVVSLCIRGDFCTDFKSIAAEAAQGDGTVPKAAKNFWKGAEKRNRISWETEHGKTESTQSGAF